MTELPGMTQHLPQVLRTYMALHGLEPAALHSDGRLGLTFDGRWRLQVRPLADGRMVAMAMVMELGSLAAGRADDVLCRLGQYASGLLRDHRACLALEAGGQRLVLQQVLAADLTVPQLEETLGDFVNVLAFWTRTAQAEVAER